MDSWGDFLKSTLTVLIPALLTGVVSYIMGRRKNQAEANKTEAEAIILVTEQLVKMSDKISSMTKEIADITHTRNECLAREIQNQMAVEILRNEVSTMRQTQEANKKTIAELTAIVDRIKKEVIT